MKNTVLTALVVSFSLVACGVPEGDDVANTGDALVDRHVMPNAAVESERARPRVAAAVDEVPTLSILGEVDEGELVATTATPMSSDALVDELKLSDFGVACDVGGWLSPTTASLHCKRLDGYEVTGDDAKALVQLVSFRARAQR